MGFLTRWGGFGMTMQNPETEALTDCADDDASQNE